MLHASVTDGNSNIFSGTLSKNTGTTLQSEVYSVMREHPRGRETIAQYFDLDLYIAAIDEMEAQKKEDRLGCGPSNPEPQ